MNQYQTLAQLNQIMFPPGTDELQVPCEIRAIVSKVNTQYRSNDLYKAYPDRGRILFTLDLRDQNGHQDYRYCNCYGPWQFTGAGVAVPGPGDWLICRNAKVKQKGKYLNFTFNDCEFGWAGTYVANNTQQVSAVMNGQPPSAVFNQTAAGGPPQPPAAATASQATVGLGNEGVVLNSLIVKAASLVGRLESIVTHLGNVPTQGAGELPGQTVGAGTPVAATPAGLPGSQAAEQLAGEQPSAFLAGQPAVAQPWAPENGNDLFQWIMSDAAKAGSRLATLTAVKDKTGMDPAQMSQWDPQRARQAYKYLLQSEQS